MANTVCSHLRPKSDATPKELAAVPGVGTAPTYDPPHRCSPKNTHDSQPGCTRTQTITTKQNESKHKSKGPTKVRGARGRRESEG